MRVLLVVCCLLSLSAQGVLAAGVGFRAFESAIYKHDAQKLKDLLDLGYGDYLKQNTEKSLMVEAVKSGDTEMVKILLDHGININVSSLDTSGGVWNGNENLISEAVSLVSQNYGITAKINNQAGSSQRAALKKNKTKTDNQPPKEVASDKGIEMIEFLLLKGYQPVQFKQNPIDEAIYKNKLGLVKYLYEKGVPMPENVYFYSVDRNNSKYYPEVYKLIDYIGSLGKGNINYQSKKTGQTALHIAVDNNDLELVKQLVAKGAKNLKDQSNKTPLDKAISKGQIEMAKVLKSAP